MTTSETLTSAFVQSSLTGVGLLDHQNKFIEVNEAFCRIYAYTREELVGQPLSIISPADYRERAYLFYQDYIKGYETKGVKQIRRKDGSSATVYLATETVNNPSAGQLKLITVLELAGMSDVPAPQPVKGEKSIAENAGVALVRCNREGDISFVNNVARTLLFLPQGHKRLSNQVMVFSGNIHRELSLIQLLNDKPTFENMELLLVRPDDTHVWVLMSAKPIILEGELHYDISVVNIEPLKKLEKKLLTKIEELKNTNKQLDHFVYGATHDLKAPLASLSGLIAILRQEKDVVQKALYLELMDKSIYRLNEFIKEIVDYSRNSNQELKIENIDFKALVDEVFESMEYMDNAPKIKKVVKVDQKAAFFSDKHRLKVVLNNLISNAYKYSSTHRRDCFINVSVHSDSKQATIQVQDNGQGIPSEHIDKIFNMFFRASEGEGGTGLGLYIVKETIDKMEGNIHVVSELGQGSSFVVTIPSHMTTDTTQQMALNI